MASGFQRAPGKPACRYGTGCYRKNADHWGSFDHPPDHPLLASKRPADDTGGGAEEVEAKRQRHMASSEPSSSTTGGSLSADGGGMAVLVFAPGAGGSTAKAMRALQDEKLRVSGIFVLRCDDVPLSAGEARWATQSAGAKSNLEHVVSVAKLASSRHPHLPIFFCGASFGCRVLAEALRTRRDELPAKVDANALICCGYPLHKPGAPEGADPKRAGHLHQLPRSVTTIFVQGERDEFLGPRGIDALRDTMKEMSGHTSLVEVPGGGHTVPGASGLKQLGKTQAQIDALVVDAIADFVKARIGQ